MDALAIAVTVIGGILVLIVEYTVFRPWRRGRRERSLAVGPIVNREEEKRLASPSATDLAWPVAIKKAVESFRELHPNENVRVVHTEADGIRAVIDVEIWQGSTSTRYSLTTDKRGEINRIKQDER